MFWERFKSSVYANIGEILLFRMDMDILPSFGGSDMMNGITYFNPTSTSGPDGYINYKMSGGDKLGSSGGPGGGFVGWGFVILMALWVIGKLFG